MELNFEMKIDRRGSRNPLPKLKSYSYTIPSVPTAKRHVLKLTPLKDVNYHVKFSMTEMTVQKVTQQKFTSLEKKRPFSKENGEHLSYRKPSAQGYYFLTMKSDLCWNLFSEILSESVFANLLSISFQRMVGQHGAFIFFTKRVNNVQFIIILHKILELVTVKLNKGIGFYHVRCDLVGLLWICFQMKMERLFLISTLFWCRFCFRCCC